LQFNYVVYPVLVVKLPHYSIIDLRVLGLWACRCYKPQSLWCMASV